MSLLIVLFCLLTVFGFYYANNPLGHGWPFLNRRFVNWLPLGMTYAFLYMGRYNLQVAKNALGPLMGNQDFGMIFGIGTGVYAFSFLVNGPLVDKLGGKKGILIAALGSTAANAAMGAIVWMVLTGRMTTPLFWPLSALYAVNMYFQSYGAVSIIKVKANWFHVRERGAFGAIFGTLISFGVYFAFEWGQGIVELTKATALSTPWWLASALRSGFVPGGSSVDPTWAVFLIDMTKATAPNTSGWLASALRFFFVPSGSSVDATWAVFFMPAIILFGWAILDWLLIKETPEDAGFPYLETHDASSGHMHEQYTTLDLLKKVFLNPLMLMFAFVELTAGVLRNGIMQWYTIFAKQVPQIGAEFYAHNWGLLLCMFGIVGGFAGGLTSDKFFQSRRGPPAALFSAFMLMMAAVMAMTLFSMPILVGLSALLIVAAVTGVHSLMSGTAAADFGGRKATATCSGIVDGCVYLGSTVQSFAVGFLTDKNFSHHSWQWWPIFLMPFALVGGPIAWRIWHELPDPTRRYLETIEQRVPVVGLPGVVSVATETWGTVSISGRAKAKTDTLEVAGAGAGSR